ncbi:MAG TPA: hypothetical protein VF545_09350 [Thermoleophilaceae bacterium]
MLADSDDVVAADCEAIGRPAGRGRKLFEGSAGDDFMGAPYGWHNARMYARAGDDVIQPPQEGQNLIDLGPGDDRVAQAGGAVDRVRGGSGRDFIDMYDGVDGPGYSDRIRCGSGHDRVIADRKDTVASDCESVKRRAPRK